MAINVAIVEDDAWTCENLSQFINDAPGFRCAASFPTAEKADLTVETTWS